MFEYVIYIPSPINPKGMENEELWDELKYDFDLGLQVGEEITISFHYGGREDKPFSFRALVVHKNKVLQRNKDDNILELMSL
jgi:hypothetical protein